MVPCAVAAAKWDGPTDSFSPALKPCFDVIEKALGVKLHTKDQSDKLGEPYLLHVLRVALAVAAEARVVAALHDTVEDTVVNEADLEGEGQKIDIAGLRYIHQNKTAALLTTSVRLGAMSANANPKQLNAITKFGRALGLAFQVIDDILDVTQTSEKLGKSAGKDVAAQKATYPAIIGLDKSRVEAKRLTKQAHATLSTLGEKGDALHALANYLLEREY